MLIRADAGHHHDESDGKVCFCDFGEKLFRQFELPVAIDVDRVSATLEKGILQIVAKKKPARQSRNVPVLAHLLESLEKIPGAVSARLLTAGECQGEQRGLLDGMGLGRPRGRAAASRTLDRP